MLTDLVSAIQKLLFPNKNVAFKYRKERLKFEITKQRRTQKITGLVISYSSVADVGQA